ncbi:MAG: hypothetical protein AB7W47_16915 [Calditrichaceae bacterium]
MQESNILSEKDKKELFVILEKHCNLVLPDEKIRCGDFSFHLYHYEKNNDADDSWVFQVRWGTHRFYAKKHLSFTNNKDYLSILTDVIRKDKSLIKKALLEHCENQLNTIAMLEIEPAINKKLPYLSRYEMSVKKLRNPGKIKNESGWPNFGVCICWYDELGNFQEFVYPIQFDSISRRFRVPPEEIVNKFQVYMDTVD